jgi:hypothetical protein
LIEDVGFGGVPRSVHSDPRLSLRELAVNFTDERKYLVFEALIYRLLKARAHHQLSLGGYQGREGVDFRPRPHHWHAAAASERQRIDLRRGRSRRVAQGQRHAACARLSA